jgi:hypothetical protein
MFPDLRPAVAMLRLGGRLAQHNTCDAEAYVSHKRICLPRRETRILPLRIAWNVFASEGDTTALLLRFARGFTHRPCIGHIDTAHLDFVFRRRSRGYFQALFRDLDPLVIPPFLAFLDVTLIRHLLPTFLAEIRAARQQEAADH